ncbi:hypothetical protein GJ496_007619 [Pomphorhynchus laevis]|nr:hypothetical protein GJ496_007619 [Pomphorhynchus laevis]
MRTLQWHYLETYSTGNRDRLSSLTALGKKDYLALAAIHSILCTATNTTHHLRFLVFPRKTFVSPKLPD